MLLTGLPTLRKARTHIFVRLQDNFLKCCIGNAETVTAITTHDLVGNSLGWFITGDDFSELLDKVSPIYF